MAFPDVCRTFGSALVSMAIVLACSTSALSQDTGQRAPIPDEAAQQKSLTLLREVYAGEYKEGNTPKEKLALADKLLAQAAQAKDEQVSRYVLLRVARDLAIQAGDVNTTFRAIDEMAAAFQMDGLEAKAEALGKLAELARATADHKALAGAAADLIQEALAADKHETAGRLADMALDGASKTRDWALRKEIVAWKKKIDEAAAAHAQILRALAALETDPVNPEANLTAGKHFCLVKGDWQKGISMLALGSDPALKALAEKELKGPTSPSEQIELGDAWWELAEHEGGEVRESLLLHAGDWYERAEPNVTAVLLKAKLTQRLKEIAKIGGRGPDAPTAKPLPSQRSPDPQTMKRWHTATIGLVGTLQGRAKTVYTLAFDASGSILASGDKDGTVTLWNTASGQVLRSLRWNTGKRKAGVWAVAFSPDGSMLAWGGPPEPIVKLCNLRTGQLQQTPELHTRFVTSVAFSPDGSVSASGSHDQTVNLWDTAAWQRKRTLEGHADLVTSVAFSPDGSLLASASVDKTVRLWDMPDGGLRTTLQGHTDNVGCVAFGPEGSLLASGSKDTTVVLWDVDAAEPRRTLQGHTDAVRSVAFSPDGSILASAGLDKTVRLWDVATGELKCTLRGPAPDAVYAVAFSPNGSVLVSGGHDAQKRSIKLWAPVYPERRSKGGSRSRGR